MTLPTAEEAFGAPSADEAFPESAMATTWNAVTHPLSGEFMDEFFSRTAVGRVLDAFGQGVKGGWGAERTGVSEEAEADLKKYGIFNDYQNSIFSHTKAFNEAIIRPLAAGWDVVMRGPMALVGGGAATVGQLAEETGLAKAVGLPGSSLARDLFGIAIQEGASPTPRFRVPDIAKAHELGVIGGDEATFQGLKPVQEMPGILDRARGFAEQMIGPAETPISTAEHVKAVADTVSQKLIKAGRPEVEANAAAQLIASHYEARAERFGGAKGNALEMFERDGPEILGAEKGGKGGMAGGKTVLKDARATITLFQKADASTVIHEVGHHWLDELMRDAHEEGAPGEVRGDAKAVMDWLKVDKAEEIKGRHHEMFAKGFEQYMREGIAPSSRLGAVFEQFRDWLTSIYQTITKLGKPINDDVKGVFDRLLSTEEPGSPASRMADVHEADAARVPPSGASPRADIVKGEAAAKGAPVEPGIGTGEAGGGPKAPEPVGAGAEPAQPPAGEAQPAGKPGAVLPGGDRAAPEGGRAREAPGGHETFSELKAKPDLAGNIRLDTLPLETLASKDGIKDVMRQAAAENADFLPQRRGVVTDAQAMELAQAAGMEDRMSEVRRNIGRAYNTEEIRFLREQVVLSAQNVHEAMVKAATGTDADVLAYAEAKAKHQVIQGQLAGATAEWGRAGRAFQKLKGDIEAQAVNQIVSKSTAQTLFQLREEAKWGAQAETPAALGKFMQDARKPSFKDMIVSYAINNLISGPVTHAAYVLGNEFTSIYATAVEKPLAGLIGEVRERIAGQPVERVYAGEAKAEAFALGHGSVEGIRAAWAAAKSGAQVTLPGEEVRLAKPNVIPGTIGKVLEAPSRGVTILHSFGATQGYTKAIHGLAYREAMRLGLDTMGFANKMAEILNNPTEEMMAEARKQAYAGVLMTRPEFDSITGNISRATNKNIFLKLAMPFVQIGANKVIEGLGKRSPFGFLDPEIKADLLGRNGAIARDLAVSKMVAGTTVGLGMAWMTHAGLVTGSAPEDLKENAAFRMEGKKEYSARIGDLWIPYRPFLGPLGLVMGVSADAYHVAGHLNEEEIAKVGAMVATAASHAIMDESWMQGMSNFLDAVRHPDRYGEKYIRSELTSLMIPYSVGMSQIAKTIDPYLRETRTIIDAALAKIPFASQTVKPRINIFGEPVLNDVPGLRAGRAVDDPLVKELDRLGVFPAPVGRTIRNVELTPEMQEDYEKLSGRMLHQRLKMVMGIPGWQSVPDFVKRTMVANAVKTTRDAARSAMLMKYGDQIIGPAMESKLEKFRD